MFPIYGLWSRVSDSGSRVQGFRYSVPVLGFRVQDFGLRVENEGFGMRV